MLQKNILLEVQMLSEIANNVTVHVDKRQISYNDVCGRVYGKCFENPISTLLNHPDDVVSKRLKFKYPIDIDPLTFSYKIMLFNLGGVIVDENDYIEEVYAMRFSYPLDDTNTSKAEWTKAWSKALYRRIKKCNFKYIDTFFEPFASTDVNVMLDLQEIIPFISVTIIVVCLFSMLSNMTNTWIRSKPWMGVASVISAGMAVAASFGLLFACGVESTYYNVALPFAILVTEVDDSFVVIACWRTTNTRDPVEKRMEDTYSNAAVSITITSLTNFCSYCIAMNCPFPLTFFGGCLALSGYTEKKGLDLISCKSGLECSITNNYEEAMQEDIFMKFFKDKVAPFFLYSSSKIIILLVYIVSLSFSIWGIISLNEGLNVFGFYPENSKITRAFRVYYNYFTKYPFSIHIVINETLDYSNEVVQKSVEDMIKKFQSHPNVADLDISWLKYYNDFQQHSAAKYSFMGYDLSTKQDFIDALRNVFLKFPGAKHYQNDIVFNHNYTDIICSRFFLLARNVSDRITESKLIKDIQKMAEEFPFNVFTHTLISTFVEQSIIIREVVFQFFWMTSLINLVIFIFFNPNILYSVVVALCISSITIQTLGYMSLWGVDLDIASMSFFVISMGFCVNYPTHICYSFLTSSDKTIKGRILNRYRCVDSFAQNCVSE
ncbi:patched domain-containing protein 3-like [Centruroides sculpturatus]|uniref:patched domain-containing protein 3-like n=1 Tax=Centruroides sculpturatus TaxID=218467 RepID=UPI000C6E1CF1|nr:patched domain-containing protein 3-like [Centruroides sculpturatus]